jgi:hypothetical protein
MRAAEEAEDIGGEELDIPDSERNRAANTPDISGLQTVARVEEQRMSEEESQRSYFLNFAVRRADHRE